MTTSSDSSDAMSGDTPVNDGPHACLGEWMCGHWRGERLGGLFADSAAQMYDTRSRITHGDNAEHSRIFTSGEMPDGLCDAGHDVALERWIHDVMARAGCEEAADVE